jgi:glycine cleavage system H lipoate-binding protein
VRKKPETVISWREAMKTKSCEEKECRHMLTGRVQYHYCSNGYRCNLCEFDQYLDEADLAAATCAVHTKSVAGFQVADSYYYHWGHSWARIEHGGFVRMGIDDFAMRLLGCPTEIRLPKLGSHLDQAEVGWSLKRERKAAAVLSPMRGVVVATNHTAAAQPAAAKKDPYGSGWLVVLEPQGLRENLKNLLFEQEAAAWLKAEAQKLESMVMSAYGSPLAATGGEIVDDIFGNLPKMKWEQLVHEFLLT